MPEKTLNGFKTQELKEKYTQLYTDYVKRSYTHVVIPGVYTWDGRRGPWDCCGARIGVNNGHDMVINYKTIAKDDPLPNLNKGVDYFLIRDKDQSDILLTWIDK